jgi:hypothetical protein
MFTAVESQVTSRCFLAGEILCWNPTACEGFPPTFLQASFITALHSLSPFPFMISKSNHKHGRTTNTQTSKHKQKTSKTRYTRTHVLKSQQTRKNEAMSREHAIMCRNKQEFVQKRENKVNVPLHKKAGLKYVRGKRHPHPCKHQAARTKDNPTPTAPRRTVE